MSLTEFLIAFAGILASGIVAYFAGGRSAKSKYDAAQSKAQLDTYRKSTEAQDALEHSSDDDITRWLRDRADK